MKPTSTRSLLLFLQLTSAAPIAYIHGVSTARCTSALCLETLSSSNGHTPATRVKEPHFPTHQLESLQEEEQSIDNRPFTPTSRILPSEALLANKPLSSSYLRALSSLHNPQKLPIQVEEPTETSPQPSKPTSALPALRKADRERYWASRNRHVEESEAKSSGLSKTKCGSMELESVNGVYYLHARKDQVARESSDVMVVGIVLIFLMVVLAIEGAERFSDLRAMITGNRRKHGAIYLEEDHTVAFIVKKPFKLQPAPPSRYQIKPESEKVFESEGFAYDSDADERL